VADAVRAPTIRCRAGDRKLSTQTEKKLMLAQKPVDYVVDLARPPPT